MADAHMAPLTPQRVNAVIDVAQRAWDGPGWWPRPCARTVRAAAHAAGIEWLVEKVSSGSNSTWVWTVWRPRAADRQAVMLRSGWTLLAGTNRLLCPSCSIDVRTALTLGPCVECGGLLLHQRAYILYPQLRVDRVRDGGKQRCQSCRGRAQRRTTGPQAPRAPLDEVEVARLRRLVGITENHRENLSWAN
jgi:hypothetical protein